MLEQLNLLVGEQQRILHEIVVVPARPFAGRLEAVDVLIAAGKIFEINTGAISRGYRTTPYPSAMLLREIVRRGGRITVSADAHRAQDVTCQFAESEALARACGATELWQFNGKGFEPVQLGG